MDRPCDLSLSFSFPFCFWPWIDSVGSHSSCTRTLTCVCLYTCVCVFETNGEQPTGSIFPSTLYIKKSSRVTIGTVLVPTTYFLLRLPITHLLIAEDRVKRRNGPTKTKWYVGEGTRVILVPKNWKDETERSLTLRKLGTLVKVRPSRRPLTKTSGKP